MIVSYSCLVAAFIDYHLSDEREGRAMDALVIISECAVSFLRDVLASATIQQPSFCYSSIFLIFFSLSITRDLRSTG